MPSRPGSPFSKATAISQGRSARLLAIADAVMNLGRALNLSIVAEGVETVEQLTILSSRSCDEVQGYLFAHPLPAEDVPRAIDGQLATMLRGIGADAAAARSA